METALTKALINWLHLTAAMVWLGAIFTTPLVLTQVLANERENIRQRVKARYHTCLSPVAWGALGVLTITGLIRAMSHLDQGWTDLITTEWGRLLSFKILLIGVMVTAGAYARYRLIPRIERSAGTLQLISVGTAALGLALLWVITLL